MVDEKMFSLTGDKKCTLEWPDYGVRIDVSEGSLPSGRKTNLCVKPIVAGDFRLPPNCYLVSSIYYISCPERFSKKVALHLPHAAIIESEEEASHFRFYAAKCSSGPPYQFKELRGGSFTPFSESACIELNQFSYIVAGAKTPPKQRYFSQVFYKLKQPCSEWDMFFVIIKDDCAFQKVNYFFLFPIISCIPSL